MNKIFKITAILIVMTVAVVGCLLIFGILSYDAAMTNLIKFAGAMALLAVCSALIAFLARSK